MDEFLRDNFLFLFPVITVVGAVVITWYIKADYKHWVKKQEDKK